MTNDRDKGAAASPLSTPAVAALQQGNKIAAIKIVREERNIGLKEAKDVVEDYVRNHPAVQPALASAQAEAKRSAVLWLAALIVAALLAYYFLL